MRPQNWQQLLGDGFDLTLYMPDQLLKEDRPDTLRSVLAGAVTIGVFLPLAVKVFDKREEETSGVSA